MSELATFLPTTGASLGGSSSFNTITVTTPVAAAVGEAIFVTQYGEYRTESQLKHADHVTTKASGIYPPYLATGLTNSVAQSCLDFPVALDPDAYFSMSSNAGVPLNNSNGLELYSSKLSGGNWLVFTGFGNGTARESSSNNNYSVNILSPDGKTLLKSTLFGESTFNGYAGSGRYNRIIALVPQANNTVKVYSLSMDGNSTGSTFIYSAIITWSGSAVTVGSQVLINGAGWSGTYEIGPMFTNPIFEYNSITYVAIPNTAYSLVLVNTATNAISSINIGTNKWSLGQVIHLVKAGTCLHLYTQVIGGTVPTVIDLTTLAVKTSGISAFLSSSNSSSGPIIKLDATTYAFQSSTGGALWNTVRHSADGYTVTTTTTTLPGYGDVIGLFSFRGKSYIARAGQWAGSGGTPNRLQSPSTFSPSPLYVSELTYNAGAATCSFSTPADTYDYLPDLIGRLTTTISSKTSVVSLSSCKYVIPLALDSGRSSSSQGTLVLHVFDYEHYTKYAPAFIGRAVTSGTSITVLLDDRVKKYSGAVEGTVYASNTIGLPSQYAIKLESQKNLIAEFYLMTQTSSAGSTFDRSGIISVENNIGIIEALGALAKTSTNFEKMSRVVEADVAMLSTPGSHILVMLYASNGRVKKQVSPTTSSSSARASSIIFRTKWISDWPMILGLTCSGGQSSSLPNIAGRISEDFIC